jgi:hypothetical protein
LGYNYGQVVLTKHWMLGWAILFACVACGFTVKQTTVNDTRVWIILPEAGESVHVQMAPRPQLVARFFDPVVINAGYFDPINGLTTSFIQVPGQPLASPQDNARLMQNEDLTPYLPAILNRAEFRRYACPDGVRYDIVPRHDTPAPCTVTERLGAGPMLLPENTQESEAFWGPKRDPIGVKQKNARSAVGLTADGQPFLLMAEQLHPKTGGLTLAELADALRQAGAVKALNLDGGSSSSLKLPDGVVYGKLNADGQPVKRAVLSVLSIRSQSTAKPVQTTGPHHTQPCRRNGT